MIVDVITGKIECKRLMIKPGLRRDDFEKKYSPNQIKLKTDVFYGPDIKIGDFCAENAEIEFNDNDEIVKAYIVFTTEFGDCETDKDLNYLIKSLTNNVMFMNDKIMSWNTLYGMIDLLRIFDNNQKFILCITYNEWKVSCAILNKWLDILWNLTKTTHFSDFCIYRKWTIHDADVIDFEYCEWYSTRNRCRHCKRKCQYRKIWSVYSSPTYKELEKELAETETIIDDNRVVFGHVVVSGTYNSSTFELAEENGEVVVSVNGNINDFRDILNIIDNIVTISSDWYKNNLI